MNKLKNEILPVISKIWEKGQDWFSQLVNATDHTMTKMMFLLKENKQQLNDYLVDRGDLLNSIKQKQAEVESLRIKIEETSKGQTERLIQLYEKLETRTDELVRYQQEYFTIQQSIEVSRRKTETLANEKDHAVNERNWLKSEYDHLQTIMKENVLKQEELTEELEQLKKKQAEFISTDIDKATIVEIEGKIKERDQLQQENKNYALKFKEVERDLLEEVKRVSELSGQLRAVQGNLAENEQAMMAMQSTIHEQGELIGRERERVEKLNFERKELQLQSISHEENYQIVLMELQQREEILRQMDDEYTRQMIVSEEKIDQLELELLNEQNELALEIERKGTPATITPEALRILEQEYEPRFKTLYKESTFQQEFYKDFFTLIPSDRLRVEAAIANLDRDFDKMMTNVRRNPVKTRSNTTVNEYPFGHDRAGRIYLKKENNKIQFFRISRTKNGRGALDQKQVITWLKANI